MVVVNLILPASTSDAALNDFQVKSDTGVYTHDFYNYYNRTYVHLHHTTCRHTSSNTQL